MDGDQHFHGQPAPQNEQNQDSQGKIQLDKLSTGRPTLGSNYGYLGVTVPEPVMASEPNGLQHPSQAAQVQNEEPQAPIENGSSPDAVNGDQESGQTNGEPLHVENQETSEPSAQEEPIEIVGEDSESDFSVEEAVRDSNQNAPVQIEAEPEVQMREELKENSGPVVAEVVDQDQNEEVVQNTEALQKEDPQPVELLVETVQTEVLEVAQPAEPQAELREEVPQVEESAPVVEEVTMPQPTEVVPESIEIAETPSEPVLLESGAMEAIQEPKVVEIREEANPEPVVTQEPEPQGAQEEEQDNQAEPIVEEEVTPQEVQNQCFIVPQKEDVQSVEENPVSEPIVEEVVEAVPMEVEAESEPVEPQPEPICEPEMEAAQVPEPVQEDPVAVESVVAAEPVIVEPVVENEPEEIVEAQPEPVSEPPAEVVYEAPKVESEEEESEPEPTSQIEPAQHEPVQESEPEESEVQEVAEPAPVAEPQPQEEEEEVEESSNSVVPIEGLLPGEVRNVEEEEDNQAPQETAVVQPIEEPTAIVEETTEPVAEPEATPAPEPAPAAKNQILLRNQRIADNEDDLSYNFDGENKVFMWGSAECDQFECENYESKRPVEIGYFLSNKIKVSKISCGSQHTLLLDNKGRAYSWGNSDNGALGRAIEGESTIPGQVDLGGQEVDLISAGDSHSVFANSVTGKLFFCGVILSSNGPISQKVRTPVDISGFGTGKGGITQLISGQNHVLILSSSKIYSFGDNSNGAIGHVRRGYNSKTDCLTPTSLNIKSVERIFTGANHCFATTRRNQLYAWGLNSAGQLGLPYYIDLGEDSDVNNSDPNRNANVLQTPHLVGKIKAREIRSIQGGDHHTLLLKTDGSIWGTGLNNDGQLGDFVHPPRESYPETQTPNSYVKVAGRNIRVLVTEDYMPNSFFELTSLNQASFDAIQARHVFSYGLDLSNPENPKYYSWGTGFNYVLANGNEDTVNTPFRISNEKFFQQAPPTGLALGHSHVAYFTGKRHPIELEAYEKKKQNKLRKRESSIANKNSKRKRVKTK